MLEGIIGMHKAENGPCIFENIVLFALGPLSITYALVGPLESFMLQVSMKQLQETVLIMVYLYTLGQLIDVLTLEESLRKPHQSSCKIASTMTQLQTVEHCQVAQILEEL